MLATKTERILPAVVLVVAIFLRFYDVGTIPRGLMPDEGWNGLDALAILDGDRPIFLPRNTGREALFIYLQAIAVALLGQTPLALRVVSATVGVLTVVAAYLLARRMFGSRVAILTCGWLAISLWHLIFSRVGLRSVSLPLFLAAGFYCLWRGLEEARAQVRLADRCARTTPDSTKTTNGLKPAIWFALGGIAIGLSLHTYSTARFAPFVIVAVALYIALLHRRLLRQTLPGLVLALALTTLIFLPQGLFFLHHPESLVERARVVWIFNPELQQGNPAKVLFDSTLRSLGMFGIRGDTGRYYNIPGRPLFDPVSALLMLIGAVLALRRFRQAEYGFLLIFLLVMFVPSLLAVHSTPNYVRATSLIPALFVLPALGAAWLWDVWESRTLGQTALRAVLRSLPPFLVLLAFLAGAIYTYHSYFDQWAKAWLGLRLHLNMDKHVTLEMARSMASNESGNVFVAGGDHYDARVAFTLLRQPEPRQIWTFDIERSIVFPLEHSNAHYILTWTRPHTPVLSRFFDEESAKIIGTAPSGRPITLHPLLNPRPEFDPQWRLPARFDDQLFVYGFDLPNDARAGGTMTVRWYWRILAIDQREFALSNQLFGEDNHRRGQLDDRGFASDYWPIGTSGISTFEIEIDPDTTTGAYWLHIAMYDQARPELPNLFVFDPQGNPVGNHLRLGPIKVHGRPPTPAPEIEFNLSTRFADQISLVGYGLSTPVLAPGESLDLTLFWSPRGRPSNDYTVFVHLLDSQMQIRGQADSPPRAGKYPTSVWDAGEVIADSHTISLGPDLPAGEYHLVIGLYDPDTGQRVAVVDEAGQATGDLVTIPRLIVEH